MHKWIASFFGKARTHQLSESEKNSMDAALQQMVQDFPVREGASDCLNTTMDTNSSLFGAGKNAHLSSEEKVSMESEMFSFMRNYPIKVRTPKRWWSSFTLYTPAVALLILAVINRDMIVSAPKTEVPTAQVFTTDGLSITSTSSDADPSDGANIVIPASSSEESVSLDENEQEKALVPRQAPSMFESSQSSTYSNQFEDHEVTDTAKVGNAIIHFTKGPGESAQSSSSEATKRTALDVPEESTKKTTQENTAGDANEERAVVEGPGAPESNEDTIEFNPQPIGDGAQLDSNIGIGDGVEAVPVGDTNDIPTNIIVTPVVQTLHPTHQSIVSKDQASFALSFVTDVSVQTTHATLYQSDGTLVQEITIDATELSAGQELALNFDVALQEGLSYYIVIPDSLGNGFAGIGAQEWQFQIAETTNTQTGDSAQQ